MLRESRSGKTWAVGTVLVATSDIGLHMASLLAAKRPRTIKQ